MSLECQEACVENLGDILFDSVATDDDRWTMTVISLGGLLVAGFVYILLLPGFEVLPTLFCGGYIALYVFLAIRNKKQAVLFVVLCFLGLQVWGLTQVL